jgi:hypothetical protein
MEFISNIKDMIIPMSADGPIPGTMLDGEKDACSMSWK